MITTNYKVGQLEDLLEKIKEMQNVIVRAQDYELAALLIDMQRHLIVKIEQDNNRNI